MEKDILLWSQRLLLNHIDNYALPHGFSYDFYMDYNQSMFHFVMQIFELLNCVHGFYLWIKMILLRVYDQFPTELTSSIFTFLESKCNGNVFGMRIGTSVSILPRVFPSKFQTIPMYTSSTKLNIIVISLMYLWHYSGDHVFNLLRFLLGTWSNMYTFYASMHDT